MLITRVQQEPVRHGFSHVCIRSLKMIDDFPHIGDKATSERGYTTGYGYPHKRTLFHAGPLKLIARYLAPS